MNRLVPILLVVMLAIACKARHSSSRVSSDQSVGSNSPSPTSIDAPVPVMFHFGQYMYLRPYELQPNGISPDKWKAIPSVSYPAEHRRGFYLSSHPAYNEKYAIAHLKKSTDKSPWMLVVRLSDTCVSSKSSPGALVLSSQSQFAGVCRQGDVMTNDRSSECSRKLAQNFDQEERWLIRDHFWPTVGFWLVRDPQCIDSIDATPDGVLSALSTVDALWSDRPFSADKPSADARYGASNDALFYILTRAIAESTTSDLGDLLEKILSRAESTDNKNTRKLIVDALKASLECVNKGKNDFLKARARAFVETTSKQAVMFDKDVREAIQDYVYANLTPGCSAPAVSQQLAEGTDISSCVLKTSGTTTGCITYSGLKSPFMAAAARNCKSRDTYRVGVNCFDAVNFNELSINASCVQVDPVNRGVIVLHFANTTVSDTRRICDGMRKTSSRWSFRDRLVIDPRTDSEFAPILQGFLP